VSAASLPLGLRNRLAELILEAFDADEAWATLSAVGRACGPGDGVVDPADAERLARLGWFERLAPGRVRLLGAHRAHARALGDRARRAAAAARAWPDHGSEEMVRLLRRAAALANHGLFFEVHELLEPFWFRAGDPARTALQGLIQVAVAFHHLENGNRDGARSLLAEGVAKVAGAVGALPLDVNEWLRELRAAQAVLATGAPVAVPRWPSPNPDEET
jgi:hypothetical protein